MSLLQFSFLNTGTMAAQDGQWLKITLVLLIIVAILAFFFIQLLRIQVAKRTSQVAESEGKLIMASQLARLGYWEHDYSKREVTWSQTMFEMMHWADNIGAPLRLDEFMSFVHPDDTMHIEHLLEQCKREGEPFLVQHRVITKRGDVLWVENQAFVSYDMDNKPVRTFGIMVDVSEKVRAADALAQSERRFSLLFNALDDALMILDKESHVILMANDSSSLLFGVPQQDLFSQSLESLLCDSFYQKITTILQDIELQQTVVQEGEAYSGAIKKKIPVELRIKLEEIDGVPRLLALVRDITSKREQEEYLLKREEMLRQAQKMESIGQLAGGIAHDFNNMLGGIIGFAELLRAEIKNEEQLDFCNSIIDSSSRAAELTQQLLAFSRRGKVFNQAIKINNVVENAVKLLGRVIDKNIEITTNLMAHKDTVLGDSAQLQNAFMNLAINARDAMPKGGALHFNTEEQLLTQEYCEANLFDLEPGHYICVQVRDTGCGMDTAVLKHIFEPFYTTKGVGKGTGLGLAAVYGTMQAHNGAIHVYSELQKGTEFHLYLPLLDNVEYLEDTSFDTNIDLPVGAKGLVADDEESVRKMVQATLQKWGVECVLVSDGQEAIEAFRANPSQYSFVLLDVVMPHVGGLEAMQGIQAIKKDVGIIVASGFSREDRVNVFMEQGAVAFLSKPFKPEALKGAIAKAMRLR